MRTNSWILGAPEPATPMAFDFMRIAEHVLRPERAGLAAARGAVAGLVDAGAAWARLVARGVIPETWACDPRRSYEHAGGAWGSHPATIEACVALASDPKGVAAAEMHAREFAARMTLCGGGAEPCVRWRVGGLTKHDLVAWPAREPTGALHQELLGVHEGADTTEWDTEAAWVLHRDVPRQRWPDSLDCADPAAFGRFTREISASELWLSAALNGYVLAGRPVAGLPDPFVPLFEIWALGYAVDVLFSEAVVLVAPAIEARRSRRRR